MALDTANKRASAINIGLPFRGILPIPDGSLSDGDRQELLYLYALEQPTKGLISFTEFSVPDVGVDSTRGLISWAEFEVGLVATRGRTSWAEFEIPSLTTRGRVSWAEFETPNVGTRGRVSWSEFEVPLKGTAGRISWAEFEVPVGATRGRISWADFTLPSFGETTDNYWNALTGMQTVDIDEWP